MPTSSRAPETARRTPRRGRPGVTLAAVSFGLFMVGLDGTVVSIANPAIAASLGTSFAELQWITNAYLLGLAVFLILGGTLGDRFGRRRMYLIGVAAFAVTSVAIGLVGSAEGVIAFRALQGLSAALLMPQTLALLRSTFPKEKFGMAVGIWGGVSSVAIAAGPIVGGALVALFGWESVFFINAPIAVVGLLLGCSVLAESTAPTRGRFDVAGVALLALGLFGLVLGVVQSESWGWTSPLTLGAIALGLVLLAAFVVVENRVGTPLVPMSLFRNPTLSVGAVAIAVNFFALFGATFFLSLFLLNLRGVSGVQAGVMLLPLSGVSIIASPLGAMLVAKWGIRPTMTTGLGLIAVSMLGLTFLTTDSAYLAMAVPFVLLALGVGLVMTSGATRSSAAHPSAWRAWRGGSRPRRCSSAARSAPPSSPRSSRRRRVRARAGSVSRSLRARASRRGSSPPAPHRTSRPRPPTRSWAGCTPRSSPPRWSRRSPRCSPWSSSARAPRTTTERRCSRRSPRARRPDDDEGLPTREPLAQPPTLEPKPDLPVLPKPPERVCLEPTVAPAGAFCTTSGCVAPRAANPPLVTGAQLVARVEFHRDDAKMRGPSQKPPA
ncbi:MFS transporter [Rathayibacter sp. VKM Ac-2630]|uniref:MFS transporter n=1 Tax=Rathayibacter sp. VKM Ac-2630 TaxID=1938617 RepID=UPI00191C4D1E|nr:MFS transporter [Rathayibacter sp. VKM Ac-2630]